MIKRENLQPEIDGSVYVGTGAVVMGEVSLGKDSSVWPGTVIRGDVAPIVVGKRSNIQDNCVLHTDVGARLVIGQEVTVGHACILHGCTVQDGALVGMGSIVLDGAVLGEECLLGAGSLVTGGTVIPSGMLAFGRPAKVVRPLTAEERQENRNRAQEYVDLKNRQMGG